MGNNLHFIRKLLILDMPGVSVKKFEHKFWGQWTDKKKSCHIYILILGAISLQRIVTGNKMRGVGSAPPSDPGCHKCHRKCKVSCPVLQEGSEFISTNTKKVYRIRERLDCDSSFVIYLGTCKKCKGQYVGNRRLHLKLAIAIISRRSGSKSEAWDTTMEVPMVVATRTCPFRSLTRWRGGTRMPWPIWRSIGRTNCAASLTMG